MSLPAFSTSFRITGGAAFVTHILGTGSYPESQNKRPKEGQWKDFKGIDQ
jgi:hypothetical protein